MTATPRRQARPLDAERTALAEAHVGWARMLARYHGKGRDLADEFESAALWGLTLAAAAYEPALGTPFKCFARKSVIGSVREVLRRKGTARRRGDRRQLPLAEPPAKGPPVGAELEAREAFERLLRVLPLDQADACRAMAEAGHPGEAARRLGITDRQFRHRRRTAAATLAPRRRELQCSC